MSPAEAFNTMLTAILARCEKARHASQTSEAVAILCLDVNSPHKEHCHFCNSLITKAIAESEDYIVLPIGLANAISITNKVDEDLGRRIGEASREHYYALVISGDAIAAYDLAKKAAV